MKQFLRKRIISGLLIACCLSIPIHFAYGLGARVPEEKKLSEKNKNVKEDDHIESANYFFKDADASIQNFTHKIARQTPITLDEVKALPKGALNARYVKDMTLLYFALLQRNSQAIDTLLKAGADPYMVYDYSEGRGCDFTYFMSKVGMETYAPKETSKLRTEIVRSYLASGGDPNHRLSCDGDTPLLINTILGDDNEGAKLLIDAGADPFASDKSKAKIVKMLTKYYDKDEADLLAHIICKNYYNNASMEQVERVINLLAPIGRDEPERWALFKKMTIYILKRHPDYQDSRATDMTFGGPIPWKKVLASDDTELCSVK